MLPKCENVSVRSISREVDYAWLAGIIDGEGNLDVRLKVAGNGKSYLNCKIRIANTDLRMIRKISEIYHDMNAVFFYDVNHKRQHGWKNQMNISVASQGSCLKVLEAVMPYLVNKRSVAEVMRDMIAYVRSCPKGGNSWSYDYVSTDTFQGMMDKLKLEKAWHIDPSTTARRARKVITW